MALMELIINSTYAGQRMLNRFHYQSSGTPAGVSLSFALASAAGCVFTTTIPTGSLFEAISDLAVNLVTYDSYQTKDLYSTTDFFDSAFAAGTTGDLVPPGASPLLAFGYRTSRVRSDIKRGFKRFSGCADGGIGANGAVDPENVLIEALRAALGDVIEYDDSGNTITFTPVVLGTEKYTTPSGKSAYRLYETESEQLSHVASGFTWEAYNTIRTQNSRQYGRGQ